MRTHSSGFMRRLPLRMEKSSCTVDVWPEVVDSLDGSVQPPVERVSSSLVESGRVLLGFHWREVLLKL